jgi:hypothetical protein
MTQNKMILNHLQQYGKINPLTALKDYGCFRLSARILDLRKEGWDIKTNYITEKGITNNKAKKTYALYTLENNDN